MGGNFYSVPFRYVGKEVAIRELDTHIITVIYRDQEIAEHHLELDQRGCYITNPGHLEGLREIRMGIPIRRPEYQPKSKQPDIATMVKIDVENLGYVEERNLLLYGGGSTAMNNVTYERLYANLERLKLPRVATILDNYLERANKEQTSIIEALDYLIEEELLISV
jgi:hypothetical protein